MDQALTLASQKSSHCKQTKTIVKPLWRLPPRKQKPHQLSANISRTKNVTLKLPKISFLKGYLGQFKGYIFVVLGHFCFLSCLGGCGSQGLCNRYKAKLFPETTDATLQELKKMALRARLEVRQSADLRRDLARRVLPSDGPYVHGVWIDDKAKYKAVGRWARARVISQNGAIVTVETDKAVLRVNQSKVRKDYDPWHDVPLPRNLDKPEKDVPLELEDGDDQLEERESQKDEAADYVMDFKVSMN